MDFSKPETINLDDLRSRIKCTDLVPSRVSLLEKIDEIFEALTQQGIHTWSDLQKAIKNPKHMELFSNETGVDLQYLVLLRREIEGYHPKPFELKEVNWVDEEELKRLLDNGISNSMVLLKFIESEGQNSFAERIGVSSEFVHYLANLCGLTRVQWVSPTTARMIIEAGYKDCLSLASADAEKLCKEIDCVNQKGKYFNGKIGLRDIKRLIIAASYIQ